MKYVATCYFHSCSAVAGHARENISLRNTSSGRFTLIYHEDSKEMCLDPAEFKRSFLPVDCTSHQVKPWLTFKSWASWLVLKKKCQVIIDRNFCQGKANTWNLYYPQGRAGRQDTFRIIPFFSGFRSDDLPRHIPPSSEFLLQVPESVTSGSLPNHIRAWSKLKEQEGEQEKLISHSVGIKPQATSQYHRPPRPPQKASGGGAAEKGRWTCSNLVDKIKIKKSNPASMRQVKKDDWLDEKYKLKYSE